MNLKCRFGRHAWNGCKCTACGATRFQGHSWADNTCQACGAARMTTDGIDVECRLHREATGLSSFDTQLAKYTPEALWSLESFITSATLEELRGGMRKLYDRFQMKDDTDVLKAVFGLAYLAVRHTDDWEVNYWSALIAGNLATASNPIFSNSIDVFAQYSTASGIIADVLVQREMAADRPQPEKERNRQLVMALAPGQEQRMRKSQAFLDNWKLIAQQYGKEYQLARTDRERDATERKIIAACRKMDDICGVHLIVEFVTRLYAAAQESSVYGGVAWSQSIDMRTGERSEVRRDTTPEDFVELGTRMLANLGEDTRSILSEASAHHDINCRPGEPTSNYDKLVKSALERL